MASNNNSKGNNESSVASSVIAAIMTSINDNEDRNTTTIQAAGTKNDDEDDNETTQQRQKRSCRGNMETDHETSGNNGETGPKKKKTKTTSQSNYFSEKKKKKIIASSVVSVEILHTLKQQHISALSLLDYVKLEYGRNMGRHDIDIDSENKERMDVNMDTTNPLQRPLQLQEKPSQERIDGYYSTPELVNSIRDNDLVKVRALYTAGKITCNACNPFGESLLHVACRRGHAAMIHYLVDTCGFGLKALYQCDDFHRTPLHDTLWSSSQSKYQIIDYFLHHPDAAAINIVSLFFVKDKRGFTPLDYSRKEEHSTWLHFLQKRKHLLRSASSSAAVTVATVANNDDEDADVDDVPVITDSSLQAPSPSKTTTTMTKGTSEEENEPQQRICG